MPPIGVGEIIRYEEVLEAEENEFMKKFKKWARGILDENGYSKKVEIKSLFLMTIIKETEKEGPVEEIYPLVEIEWRGKRYLMDPEGFAYQKKEEGEYRYLSRWGKNLMGRMGSGFLYYVCRWNKEKN